MEKVTIYTHDGIAHADEAFAVAALSLLYPDSETVRTRNLKTLKSVVGNPGVFLLDVGGVYNPENREFDHHQPAGAGFREPDNRLWPYATAGLVWKHYGLPTVSKLYPTLDSFNLQETVNYIDMAILRYVDALDCGIRLKTAGPSISSLVSSFNSPWFEPRTDQFPLIVTLCQQILVNYIKRFVARAFARDEVRMSRLEMAGQLLVLDNCVPWNEVVAREMPDVKLVAYPAGSRGNFSSSWQLYAASAFDGKARVLFPASWAGKEFQTLAEISGVQGAIFCHRSRHLVGVHSYEDMLHMATIALREIEKDQGKMLSEGNDAPKEGTQHDIAELLQAHVSLSQLSSLDDAA